MKQRPTRKGKDAEVMGQDSLFAIQRDLFALNDRLTSLIGGSIVTPEIRTAVNAVDPPATPVKTTESSKRGRKPKQKPKRKETPSALPFIEPNDVDTGDEITIRYSQSDPLSLVLGTRKVKLTMTTFRLFRYFYNLYQSERQTAFTFADISEGLTGDDCGLSTRNIDTLKRRLAVSLEKFRPSPLILTIAKEVLYIRNRKEVSAQQELDLTAGEEKANRRGRRVSVGRGATILHTSAK